MYFISNVLEGKVSVDLAPYEKSRALVVLRAT